MKRSAVGLTALLALAVLVGAAGAQEAVIYQQQGGGGEFTVTPDGGGGPLFLDGDGGAAGPTPPSLRSGGTVNGNAVNTWGSLLIGFDYLHPFWSFRDFTLAVPKARAGAFPLLGDTGHVDDHFALAPRVNYNYDFADWGFGVGVSGTFLTLTGSLDRQVSSAGGDVGHLAAHSQLTLASANLVEVHKEFDAGELLKNYPLCCDLCRDVYLDLHIGTRVVTLDQNYTGSLTDGANGAAVSTRYSTQSFRGIGLTTALNSTKVLSDNWALFSNLRGSILVGDNRQDSSLTVVNAGQPAIAATIQQTKTEYVPVGELETGVVWRTTFGDRATPVEQRPVLTLRLAFVGDVWGDVGPLSAGSSQGYRSSDLFLVGANFMVGVER